MKYSKYYLILLIFSLMSCYKDIDDVNITGIITDSITKRPIENVKVSIICWRYGNTPDGSYTGQDTVTITTNREGKYFYNFRKGAFIEIITSISTYQSKHESIEVTTKNNILNLKLKSSSK